MNKKIAGFTLIEMLVVVAIIAILASVFLIGLRGFRGSAYDSRRLSDLQKVQSYLELYYNQGRAYPNASTWDELNTELSGAGLGITSIPNDPLSSQSYYYGVDDDFQSYVLGAMLSDPSSSLLTETADIDESTFGVDCTDPIYCIRF